MSYRKYIESLCNCAERLPESVPDKFAVDYYTHHCSCGVCTREQSPEPQSGRTYRQILDAPAYALYVVHSEQMRYYANYAFRELNKPYMISVSLATFLNEAHDPRRPVVFDHAVFESCPAEHRIGLFEWLNKNE